MSAQGNQTPTRGLSSGLSPGVSPEVSGSGSAQLGSSFNLAELPEPWNLSVRSVPVRGVDITALHDITELLRSGPDLRGLIPCGPPGSYKPVQGLVKPLAAFVVSCCGRGEDMHGEYELEAKAHSNLLSGVPIFANGEVGPRAEDASQALGRGYYHELPIMYGYTTCMGLLVTDTAVTTAAGASASGTSAADEEE